MQPVLRGAAALFAVVISTASAAAVAPPPTCPQQVTSLIQDLDADAFRTRQSADAALRAMGRPVLPFVREELTRTRSPEVRHRLQLIEQHLTRDSQVANLVQLLGHKDKRFHLHADRTLRNAGADILPLLKEQLNGDLPPPHRQRLQKLVDDLTARANR